MGMARMENSSADWRRESGPAGARTKDEIGISWGTIFEVLAAALLVWAAVLLALAVSPIASAAVLALYILYHVVENYVLIPRVYGRRLRLSGPAVRITLVVGGMLQGILGAVLVLPLVAAYPIVERIWLHEYLSDEALTDHSALEEAAENGSDAGVERVLRGQELPPGETR